MDKKPKEPNEKKIAALVRQLLIELGEDPERDGLLKTPTRVAKSLAFLTRGYRQTPRGVLNNAIFDAGADHMIVLRNVELYSMCEHHMLPFYGSCAIGYIAKNKVLGVSKIARIVDCFARRLQIQERLTEQVAEAIQEAAKAEAEVTGEAVAVIAPSSNKTIGVKSREYWGFRIVDPLLVPRAYCKPDEVAIGAYKDAARKNGAKVEDLKMDGVEFYREIRV